MLYYYLLYYITFFVSQKWYSIINYKKLRNVLETINWEAFCCNDVNVFYDKFLQKLTELTNSCKIEHRAKLALFTIKE